MINRLGRIFICICLCVLYVSGVAFGEDPITSDIAKANRAGLAKEIQALEPQIGSEGGGIERDRLQALLGVMKETDLLWQQVLAGVERRDGLSQELADLEGHPQGKAAPGTAGEQAYSFRQFDRLRNELEAEQAKKLTVEASLVAAEENLHGAKDEKQAAERARRAAKEAAETNEDPSQSPELAGAQELAEVQATRAGALVALRGVELEVERLNSKIHQQRRITLTEQVEQGQDRVRFRQDDFRSIIGELDKREFEVGRELERAKEKLEYVQARWQAATKKMDTPGADEPSATAEVQAKRLARNGRQSQVRALTKELERLARMKQIWEHRYRVARGSATDEQKTQWELESGKSIDQLGRDALLPEARLSELREDLTTIVSRIEDAGEKTTEGGRPQLVRWLEQQRWEIQFEMAVWERDRTVINQTLGLEQKLGAELGARSVSVAQRFLWVWEQVVSVWKFELTSVDDRPITVGKIVMGMVLLVMGVWLSRFISALFSRRVLIRLGMNASASAAIQTVVFYVLVLTFALFALHLVNVPLGVFTVLGGAVAIGVGFGSQNVMNNFISGLIILAERPIKIKDLVQIGDLYGTIERIGARSTRVRTSANIDIIVPNSAFLEQNVINWTLSDNQVRTMVPVGVAYGSDVQLVTDLLMRAATEHGKVLDKPETPTILFKDFADNSLVFELHFWIFMQSQMQRLKIESDVRYRIDKLFAEAGVVIAFPQRDVHLDVTTPVPVCVVPTNDEQA